MQVKYAKFIRADLIEAKIDEEIVYIPNDRSNRYRRLLDEWESAGNTVVPIDNSPTGEDVNRERERRIQVGKLMNGGIYVAGSDIDRRNLSDLCTIAQLRLSTGDNTTKIPYRDFNNVIHMLVPSEVIALYVQSAEYVSRLYIKSWELKDNIKYPTIPADYTDDKYW